MFLFFELAIRNNQIALCVTRGFQSTSRANPLAQKILASDIALGNNDFITFYSADNCRFSTFFKVVLSFALKPCEHRGIPERYWDATGFQLQLTKRAIQNQWSCWSRIDAVPRECQLFCLFGTYDLGTQHTGHLHTFCCAYPWESTFRSWVCLQTPWRLHPFSDIDHPVTL